MPLNQASVIQRPQISQSAPTSTPTISNTTENNPSEEGIPDNVTAELEKLEQETGNLFCKNQFELGFPNYVTF